MATWSLSEGQSRMWDTILKAVGGILTLSGALITALKYLDDKVNATEVAKSAARKDFSIKQQEIYFNLIEITSDVSNGEVGTPGRAHAESAFWRMFWGPLIMVEDRNVAVAADAFSLALHDDPTNGALLLNKSMDVAHACRASLGDIWSLNQADLPKSPMTQRRPTAEDDLPARARAV